MENKEWKIIQKIIGWLIAINLTISVLVSPLSGLIIEFNELESTIFGIIPILMILYYAAKQDLPTNYYVAKHQTKDKGYQWIFFYSIFLLMHNYLNIKETIELTIKAIEARNAQQEPINQISINLLSLNWTITVIWILLHERIRQYRAIKKEIEMERL